MLFSPVPVSAACAVTDQNENNRNLLLLFMKSKYIILVLLSVHYISSAQLAITPGGQLSVFSDTRLTLYNTDLINNGNFFLATTAPVSFTGDANSLIGGDQVVRFFKMEINKSGNKSVVLQKSIGVGSGIFFTRGFLDLNGLTIDLESSGSINGENDERRIVGANGGQVILRTTLNAPSNINPGNLGISFTSNQDLGEVVIKRGHQSQSGSGLITSIKRYYEISPVNNNSVNISLRITYFDRELNGLDENSLELFKSDDQVNWSNLGSSARDAVSNFVEKTSINPFSRFTLSALTSPLPIRFML